MTHEQGDSEITKMLSRLRDATHVPPIDADREQALLAAFETHWARPQSGAGRRVWMTGAAALVAVTVASSWLIVTDRGQIGPLQSNPDIDLTDFVSWPGADAWPMFESGALVRIDLPVSLLPPLGLSPLSGADDFVEADIVVGQDGLVRAFRLVQHP